ncbi:MAG: NADH dehydrogenase subunit [Chloroflexi bacterium HGW-Chloroflexi-2]|jgi:NADH-quinone oxidoreductase subunit D|nr:MAG: NADH dehydrogenase subunit [Chloroflexi bacterium HGW-Chloroflexi-2]
MTEAKKEKFIVPIGPQHPALKEPGNFEFTVDGEIVTDATVRLGFVHRGIEKACETRNYTQDMYLLERVCGICSHVHATAFVLGVEKLAGVQAPPRAEAIRVLAAELERIHSHLLWFGVAAHEAGFDTLFMYTWRDREVVMDILETLSGSRVHYSVNILGGVKIDIDQKLSDLIKKDMDFLEERTEHYMKVVTTDETFLGRTRGIGTLSRDRAKLLGAVGPTARASGVKRDVRVNAPYSGYKEFPVKMVIDQTGDLEARFVVRLKELYESYRLIREILEKIQPGEISTRIKRKIPEGEVISRVEAPRGELFYFIKSNGTEMPDRVKVRTPSLCNWGTITDVAVGHKLADMPMLLAGIDPCFSCNDRMVEIRSDSQPSQMMNWDGLRKYGIEYYK